MDYSLIIHDDDTLYTLLRDKLTAIGVDKGRIAEIFQGAPLFGEEGRLDSINIVTLIAVLSDHCEAVYNLSGDLFDLTNDRVFDAFQNVTSLTRFLRERLHHD
ncbi:hypothetical protein DZA65_00100 [Dickeya dianthicola]|uniref:Carrier domain-containing protein n=1 Tax=Dickeya dianthicola TaxID=204039 RepID=A0AAP2CWH7_9GAMM|nr:hypothetical protein [Dickeya dianthicola]AYC17027.1 hypothetical protein DZA65_00100 [Dickeya dianthicola]MBI0438392.1 hypothetical protein [Dickeya dianthicola]MBI0448605.1 hypothetical protein [Dickeya dianthicola]MBI0453273.1 hypothetical protein [Dickeya dianthicola]MBI0458567.1 hypothetical protein [Dickeya dianthicola]